MALLGKTFVTDEEADSSIDPMPAGTVATVIIKDSDLKTTRAGNGEYIKITMEVAEPEEYAGRLVWHNFNVVNPNEKAVQIGRGQLKRLNQILGIKELEDTAELHGQPFKVSLGVQQSEGYDPQNTVKKFLPLTDEPKEGGSDDPWE